MANWLLLLYFSVSTLDSHYLIMDENFSVYSKNEELFLEADLYETNATNVKDILPKIRQIIDNSGFTDKFVSLSFIQENPTVINDEKLTNIAIKTLRACLEINTLGV